MANFNNLALTTSGIKALLEAQTGNPLKLTKIGMGSGSVSGNTSSLKAMVTPKVIMPISEAKINSDGYMTITASMTNESLTEGFYWKETGLFFKDASGNEVLFAYACITNDQYDYIPAYSDQRYIKQVRIANILTNTANITVEEAEGLVYVDTMTFELYKEETAAEIEDNVIHGEAAGTDIVVKGTGNAPFLDMKLYGKTTQGENPSPNNPQPLDSKGKYGNLFDFNNMLQKRILNWVTTNLLTAEDVNDFSVNWESIQGTSNVHLAIASPFKFKAGKTIYYNGNFGTNLLIYDSTGKYVSDNINFSYTPSKDFEGYIGIGFNVGLTADKDNYIIFSYDKELKTPRPYSGQLEIESIVGTDNILDASNPTVTRSVTTSFDEERGVLTITNNGSWTQWFYDFDAVKGETYKFVCESLEGVENNNKCLITFSYPNEAEFKSAHMYYKVLDFTATETRKHRLCLFTNQSNNVATDTIKIIKPRLYNVNKSDGVYRSGKKQSHISLVADGLKGIPVTDSSLATYTDENGQMWCSDYVDCDRGVLVQRIHERIYDGTSVVWEGKSGTTANHLYTETFGDDVAKFKPYIPTMGTDKIGLYCSHFPQKVHSALFDNGEVGVSYYGTTPHQLRIGVGLSSELSTLEAMNAWCREQYAKGTPLRIAYILATPIETPLSADEIASYKALKSNYKVTSVMNNCDAYTELKYLKNTPNGKGVGDVWENILKEVARKYVSLKGGNLTGQLNIINEFKHMISLINADGAVNLKAQGAEELTYRILALFNPDKKSDITDSLKWYNIVSGVNTGYKIFGEHNKPRGSYTGNGSATTRTVNTGGIGNALLLNGYGYSFIVLTRGAIGVYYNNGTVTSLSHDKLCYENGILTISTDDVAVNANGSVYTYECL